MRKFKLLLTGVLLLSSFAMFAQQTLKGVVKEKATGEGLPGVTLVIKGTTNGSSTNFDGNFELKNVKTGDIIVVAYLGFKNKEVTIGSNFNITIELEENAESLDEIVVIGYGTTTIKDATGSVEAITAKDFTKGNIVTPENLLSGRVSGVNITQSGAPGAGGQIRIRGGASVSGNNDPLIIIDGLPLENVNLSTINPNDIESFSILKDASATAIYGSRAANGVIIITTKKGGKTFSADLDVQYSSAENQNRINVFSADEFRNLIAQQLPGRVGDLGTANTDWQDEIFRTASQKITNLSLRGSLLGMPSRLSMSNTVIEGVLIHDKYRRSNLSLSLNPSFFDNHLKVSLNANYADDSRDNADQGQIGAALRYDPTQPVFDPSSLFGFYYQHRNGNIISNGTRNPVAALAQNTSITDSDRIFGNLKFDYKFHGLPELSAVVELGYDKQKFNSRFLTSSSAASTDPVTLFKGSESYSNFETTNSNLNSYVNYENTFDKLKVKATVGYSYQKFEGAGSFTGNLRDPLSVPGLNIDDDVINLAYFSRLDLTYNKKFLFTANYRRDGTSRFGANNRWGNFYGIAGAWKLGDEDFLKDSKVVSSLKLRVSYGKNGQQEINEGTIYLDRFRFGDPNSQITLGGVVISPAVAQAINKDLKWEEVSTVEVGIDYGLFDDRITGSISAYRKKSIDLLFPTQIAEGVNFTNRIVRNIGDSNIDGLEFSINANIIEKENMNWNLNFNGSFFKREISNLPLGLDITTGGIAGGTGNFIQLLREGFAPNSFFVFKQLYDTSGSPIEGAYADLDGNGVINDDDRYIKNNGDPDVTFGFQSSFDYEGFDLAFNLRASIGNYVYNNVNSSNSQLALLQDQSVLGNVPTSVLNTNFINTSDVIISDIYVENGSFLKMDNITLGYTMKNPFKGFKSIRFWTGVQNVFIITDYSGIDPEVFGGIDNTIYPRARTFLFGTNIKF
tara:strand:+ start:4461 stop:7346 length:2886 start_codon:yes stop_codon:yes gene_type:complete